MISTDSSQNASHFSSSPNPSSKNKHSKLILTLMILIVVGPFLFAWVMLQKGALHQLRTTNHGDLIYPPPSISNITFSDNSTHQSFSGSELEGKWWLVYTGGNECNEASHKTFYHMRQIRTALGKNADRVERLFIPQVSNSQATCELHLKEHHPELKVVTMQLEEFAHTFGVASTLGSEITGELYIIDPHGNIMMHYAGHHAPKEILSDMKRLLKVSKIG